MNWYKKSQQGEWWIIDGQALFADAKIGDMNHSGYVIETILSNYDIDVERFDLSKVTEEWLREKGLDDEEINVVFDKTDPRIYGMEKLGWKRVAGRNVQTQTLTTNDLKDIANGLYDANNDLTSDSNEEFNIEVMATGAFYTDVPYNVICQENPALLRQYQRAYA